MNAPSTSPLRVYVVDESPLVRERLAEHIGPEICAAVVGEAEDAETALAGIRETDAEVVVLDLRLVDGSGIDVLDALRDRTDAIVTIVLSNHSTPDHRRAGVAAGADYFFDKTTEFDLAMNTIAQLARDKCDGFTAS
jgi:DNA-binding NarL/FixJ family response regulator